MTKAAAILQFFFFRYKPHHQVPSRSYPRIFYIPLVNYSDREPSGGLALSGCNWNPDKMFRTLGAACNGNAREKDGKPHIREIRPGGSQLQKNGLRNEAWVQNSSHSSSQWICATSAWLYLCERTSLKIHAFFSGCRFKRIGVTRMVWY
jgi:hypothetical protein